MKSAHVSFFAAKVIVSWGVLKSSLILKTTDVGFKLVGGPFVLAVLKESSFLMLLEMSNVGVDGMEWAS